MCKSVTKTFTETVITSDWVTTILAHLREIVVSDIAKVSDYVKKAIEKPVSDVFKGIDWVETYTAVSHLVEVSDIAKVSDYISKSTVKVFTDSFKGIDWVTTILTHVREVVVSDIAKVSDYLSKGVTKTVTDAFIGLDWVTTALGKLVTVSDVAKAIDVKVTKDITKAVSDTAKVIDFIAKGVALVLRDYFVGEQFIAKGVGKAFRDIPKMTDILTKVAFTLYGMDSRRVYFHKVWGDIIEPEDHNIKVDAAQKLLEAIKRLKQKLES